MSVAGDDLGCKKGRLRLWEKERSRICLSACGGAERLPWYGQSCATSLERSEQSSRKSLRPRRRKRGGVTQADANTLLVRSGDPLPSSASPLSPGKVPAHGPPVTSGLRSPLLRRVCAAGDGAASSLGQWFAAFGACTFVF